VERHVWSCYANVRLVFCGRGRMIPSELERLILERKAMGHIPFFVNATAGTTVLGAFDPIEPIADICQKYKLWLHVDVSSLLYSCKQSLLLIRSTHSSCPPEG
jgi:cysteine sulfinate desulfinase/cysteine desulfurase-like protein